MGSRRGRKQKKLQGISCISWLSLFFFFDFFFYLEFSFSSFSWLSNHFKRFCRDKRSLLTQKKMFHFCFGKGKGNMKFLWNVHLRCSLFVFFLSFRSVRFWGMQFVLWVTYCISRSFKHPLCVPVSFFLLLFLSRFGICFFHLVVFCFLLLLDIAHSSQWTSMSALIFASWHCNFHQLPNIVLFC